MASLSKLAPDYAWIQQACLRQGIGPGLLGVSAVLCWGLASVARMAAHRPARPEPPREDTGLEPVITDLVQVRGMLQDMRIDLVHLKDRSQIVLEGLQGLATNENEGQQDAVFRLAASLDQVGARLDQQINAQHESMQALLQQIHASLLTACARLDEIHGRIGSTREVRVPGSSALPEITRPQPPTTPLSYQPTPSLGLLDALDDGPFVRSITPASPNGRSTEPQAPLPAPRGEQDGVLNDKLAQLRALMADGQVRQALEALAAARG
jgi:hypothetical protein